MACNRRGRFAKASLGDASGMLRRHFAALSCLPLDGLELKTAALHLSLQFRGIVFGILADNARAQARPIRSCGLPA